SPATRYLAFSAREDTESVCEMLQLGASGYLVKGAADREIVEAIHRAARSQLSMSADLATACFRALLADVSERKKAELTLLELVRKAGHEREELLVHLVRAQETERLRIASDIHDDSIQAMAAAGLRLQQLRKRLRTEAEVDAPGTLGDALPGGMWSSSLKIIWPRSRRPKRGSSSTGSRSRHWRTSKNMPELISCWCAWRTPIRAGACRSMTTAWASPQAATGRPQAISVSPRCASEPRSREAGGSWNRTGAPAPASRSGC